MNIIITGASEGIGHAVAKQFASESGNRVFVLARRTSRLKELESMDSASPIIPVTADIASYDFSILKKTLEDFDVHLIDILINNAGFLVNKPFDELMPEDWETIYKVNVFGPALLIRSLLPFLGNQGRSHIINTGSIGGVRGSVKFPGLSAYSSSKGAISILTECLAEEFRDRNIIVNCLALGAVQTEMLARAFPGYVAKTTVVEMSGYICDFAVRGMKLFNGKIIEVSSTNP